MKLLRQLTLCTLLSLAFLAMTFNVTSAKARVVPGCQSYCLGEAVAFEIDCYWIVGDASLCTQWGHDYYCVCRRNCDDGGSGPDIEISCH